MKTYVITLSKRFLAGHNRAGQSTMFQDKFLLGIGCPDCSTVQDLSGENISPCNSCQRACLQQKIHTIRANYPLWEKRISEVERGEACLSIRQWTDKPYQSKQVEIARLTKEDGVGIQKAYFFHPYDCGSIYVSHKHNRELIATNDGLSLADWLSWFSSTRKPLEPMAVIHFTKFRY